MAQGERLVQIQVLVLYLEVFQQLAVVVVVLVEHLVLVKVAVQAVEVRNLLRLLVVKAQLIKAMLVVLDKLLQFRIVVAAAEARVLLAWMAQVLEMAEQALHQLYPARLQFILAVVVAVHMTHPQVQVV